MEDSTSHYKNVHCVAPFSSLLLLTNIAQACCNWQADQRLTQGPFIDRNKTINEIFNGTNGKIRDLFLNGKFKNYKICNKCFEPHQHQYKIHNMYAQENANHDYITNPLLTSLHIQPSNLCNLACRFCSPNNSNLLAAEKVLSGYDQDVWTTDQGDSVKKYEIKKIAVGTPLFDSIIQQVQHLNYLWFSGGEPLINPEVWVILKHAVSHGYSKNISLKFNTNGTVSLTNDEIEILKSFKHLDIDMSLDGVGELGEYIRTNLKFDKWVENYKIYKREFQFATNYIGIVYTLTVYNVHKVVEFYRAISGVLSSYNMLPKIHINHLHYPAELCISNLPDPAKKYIIEKYEFEKNSIYYKRCRLADIIEFMSTTRNPRLNIEEFIENKDKLAIKSGLHKNYKSYKDIEPEWFELLKHENIDIRQS